ncbi:MAG: holo-ACP synthase [Betaproteobacteria bacterium]|nr:MAG: holo-ACP synthase [Betaproteobacteria bacterium]
MIAGIGVDLVDKKRIDRLVDQYGEQFIRRVLNADEQEQFANSSRKGWFVANRFAAKEAISKALGTGLRYPVTLLSIGVLSNEHGRPEFFFSEALQTYLQSRNIGETHLSITHENDLVCAMVVVESLE